MFRSTNLVISMLLLCFLFMPISSIPVETNERSKVSQLNRQKRTFGLGLFGTRNWSTFHKTLRLPTFSTIPTFVHYLDEEEMYHNLMKKISDLEIGQERIVNYFQRLNANNNNANPCETTSTTTTTTLKPSLANLDIIYREPMTTAASTTSTTTQEAATEVATEATNTETSKVEDEEMAELDVATPPPALEELVPIRQDVVDLTDKNENDVL